MRILLSGLMIMAISTVTGCQEDRPNPKDDPAKFASEMEVVQALTALDLELRGFGFIDVQELDPTLVVDLKYASENNFMGENVYGNLTRCYLRPEAASKLVHAHDLLKQRHPDYRLLIVDGLRPRRVQQRMWDAVRNTPMQPYVANPSTGSMHNYGMAVDLTIIDENGNRLDMGTPMDYFGALSQPRLELRFLREGLLTPEQVSNRRLLREIMTQAGFIPLAIEWWHFEALGKNIIRASYEIVE